MIALQIGGAENEYVRVEATGQDDEGWVHVRVSVAAGAFLGTFRATFDSYAFQRLAAELSTLYSTLSGTAIFSTLERQLELVLTGNGRGQIEAKGVATDTVGTGNRLEFLLHIDQTDVPRILTDLETVLAKYPARVA